MNRFLAIVFSFTFLLSCSDSSNTAGATSETTNGIALLIVDVNHMPIAFAKVKLYEIDGKTIIQNKESDSLGNVIIDSLKQNAYIECISGEDSSQMSWNLFSDLDSSSKEILVLPSASLNIRSGVPLKDSLLLFEQLNLLNSPYKANRFATEYNFGCVPQGIFDVAYNDSTFFTINISSNDTINKLVYFENLSKEFIFENFDDGDSINNLAKGVTNYGWYIVSLNGGEWSSPDSSNRITQVLKSDNAYKGLSFNGFFDLHDTGAVLLGTHLKEETSYVDLCKLTAIRIAIKGNGNFAIALEYFKEIKDGNYYKSFWTGLSCDEWREFIFKPGEEIVDSLNYQVKFSDICDKIGLFSIFASSGTQLSVDEVVFEGLDEIDLKN